MASFHVIIYDRYRVLSEEIHAPDEWKLQKSRESCLRSGALLHAL